jgi:Acetamidase/Formamidase family
MRLTSWRISLASLLIRGGWWGGRLVSRREVGHASLPSGAKCVTAGRMSTGVRSKEAYAICSVAVDLEISHVVAAPTMLVSAFLPADIFAGRS